MIHKIKTHLARRAAQRAADHAEAERLDVLVDPTFLHRATGTPYHIDHKAPGIVEAQAQQLAHNLSRWRDKAVLDAIDNVAKAK